MKKLSIVILSSFWLLDLLNPVFKKYDYGAEWPMVILLSFFCLFFFLAFRKEKSAWTASVKLEQIFIFVFLVFVGLSQIFSQTKNIGFNELMAFYSCFSVYLIFAYRENKWLGKFLKIIVIGAVLASILGFAIYILKEAPPRMIGSFFNIFYDSNLWPNAFALALVTVWPLFILFLFNTEKANKKTGVFWLIGLSLVLSALFLTYSRGALLTAIFQAVILLIYFIKRINFAAVKKIAFIGLLSAFLVVSLNLIRDLRFNNNVISFSDKLAFQNQENLTSVKERYDFWKGAFKLSLDSPLFGYGPYSFRYIYEAKEQKDLLAIADHPHNVFLKIAVENGFVACAAFIGFLLTILVVLIKNFKKFKNRAGKDLSFILAASIAGNFAHNMIDYNLNFLANLLLLFLLLSFLRSILVQNFYSKNLKTLSLSGILPFSLALFIFIFSIYEGGILVATKVYNEDLRSLSLYPREYYTKKVDYYLVNKDFPNAEKYAKKELSLNSYDSKAWEQLGKAYDEQSKKSELANDYPRANDYLKKAVESFKKAIEVNPYNTFAYYKDYYETLKKLNDKESKEEFKKLEENLKKLLEDYVLLAKNNVHFTSYTLDADAAADLYFEINGSESLRDIIEKQRASRKL